MKFLKLGEDGTSLDSMHVTVETRGIASRSTANVGFRTCVLHDVPGVEHSANPLGFCRDITVYDQHRMGQSLGRRSTLGLQPRVNHRDASGCLANP